MHNQQKFTSAHYSHLASQSDRGSVFHSPSSRGKEKLELNTTSQMLLPKSDRTHFHSFQMSKDLLFNQQGTASYPEIQDLGTLNSFITNGIVKEDILTKNNLLISSIFLPNSRHQLFGIDKYTHSNT